MSELILTNPLTKPISDSINHSKERLNIAVPFLTSFATKLFNKETTSKIVDKRIVTRFDESNLTSFDLPTLKKLLDLGFEIRFDNSIHLKLYIADYEVYVTSSNLTEAGFNTNIELTVKIDSQNTLKCFEVFNSIWNGNLDYNITYDLININWDKYEVLRKREQYNREKPRTPKISINKIGKHDIQDIIGVIFNQKNDYSKKNNFIYEANKMRGIKMEILLKRFDPLFFYSPKGHRQRRDNLFYDFVYGYESKLADTGLREKQFKEVFEHPDLKKVINYIYPEILGVRPWNLSDKNEFEEFCTGIFDFKIPQYSEAIPIRLASYFYPDYFIPIFNLKHLEKGCKILGLETDAKTKGEKLFVYNSFLTSTMKSLPFNNYIKSEIMYKILFAIELMNELDNDKSYKDILDQYTKDWEKDLIRSGYQVLSQLEKTNSTKHD